MENPARRPRLVKQNNERAKTGIRKYQNIGTELMGLVTKEMEEGHVGGAPLKFPDAWA